MKGSEQFFISYLEGPDKRFTIPVYQRNYDWKKDQCKQLLDDLLEVVKSQKVHFFGSIVSVQGEASFSEHLVIDGQQRLTTITILLIAIYNLIKYDKISVKDHSLSKKIYEAYLVDPYKEKRTLKLTPVKQDQKALYLLFDDPKYHVKSSNITSNYDFFYEILQHVDVTADQLFEAIKRLEIINISLGSDDNPQLIFESLNSTGLALSESDKVRNYVLMGLPSSKVQEDYYDNYWHKIEINTNFNVGVFLRDYLSVKTQKISPINSVYIAFKRYVNSINVTDSKTYLHDMLSYSERYKTLIEGKTTNKELNACIERLNRLETTVTRPFFLEVLKLFDDKQLTIDQVKDVFILTESYLFRRSICSLPTNALNKIFLSLNKEILKLGKGLDAPTNYVEQMKYALLSRRETSRFPRNEEFTKAFSERDVYNMATKNRVYILERFENSNISEDKDVYRHCEDGEYTIEHIMPQTLTEEWKKDLGDNYQDIYDTWIHRIANLTLTAYNREYSNSSFEIKKNLDTDDGKGFALSGLRLNTYIAKQNQWTESELKERNKLLMDEAIKIWKQPQTSFVPLHELERSVSLSEDSSLSNCSIDSFTFKSNSYKAKNWVDMFEKVIRLLHADDQSILNKLVELKYDPYLSTYVSSDKNQLRDFIEIEPNIYVEKNTSTDKKMSILKKLFKQYDVDPDDLVIFLKK